MNFCFRKIGLPVIGAIKHPGYLEGGDFFPAGQDLCFIGVGTPQQRGGLPPADAARLVGPCAPGGGRA